MSSSLKLPAELRVKIYEQLFNKPHIHYVRLVAATYHNISLGPQQQDPEPTWYAQVGVVPKSQDKSGWRLMDDLFRAFWTDDEFRYEYEKRHENTTRFPFPRVTAHFEAFEDLVCFEFDLVRPSAVLPHGVVFCMQHDIAEPKLNRNGRRVNLYPYSKIAVQWNAGVGGRRGPKTCGENTNVLAPLNCKVPHQKHANFMLCPEEVAGFVSMFPQVEELYIIVKPQDSYMKFVFERYKMWINAAKNPRRSELKQSLRVWHDKTTTYREYNTQCAWGLLTNPEFQRYHSFLPITLHKQIGSFLHQVKLKMQMEAVDMRANKIRAMPDERIKSIRFSMLLG